MPQQSRQVAYKLWISDLVNGKYILEEGWQPNYIQVDEQKISRVNIIANVVDTFINQEESYATITIDDGSETIRVKAFKEDTSLLKNIKIGDMLLIIGRPREYNNEIYIIPEIIKTLNDPNWELVRKLELLKIRGKPKIKTTIETKQEITETTDIEQVTEITRQKILTLIEKSNEEANINSIIEQSGLDPEAVQSIIDDLLKEGEIYQPKAGALRII